MNKGIKVKEKRKIITHVLSGLKIMKKKKYKYSLFSSISRQKDTEQQKGESSGSSIDMHNEESKTMMCCYSISQK